MDRHSRVLIFLEHLRQSFVGAEFVYTHGSCIRLSKVLAAIWPEAVCYYDQNHAITRIGDRYYDITGEVQPTKNHVPLEECRFVGAEEKLGALVFDLGTDYKDYLISIS